VADVTVQSSDGDGSQAAGAAIESQAASALTALVNLVGSFGADVIGTDLPQIATAIGHVEALGPGSGTNAGAVTTLQNLQGNLKSQCGQWQQQGHAIISQLESIMAAGRNLAAPPANSPASGTPVAASPAPAVPPSVQQAQQLRQILSQADEPGGQEPATQALVDGPLPPGE
jgi:hypothetical protein